LEVTNGLSFSFEGDEIPLLRRELGHGIKWGWDERGRARPRLLFAMLQAAARAERESSQVTAGSGTDEFRDEVFLPASDQPDTWLTIAQAASLAGVSQSFMRRVARRGRADGADGVDAWQAAPGAPWRVDIAGLNAWIVSRRRKERDHRAA
jgi:hypothetical protein